MTLIFLAGLPECFEDALLQKSWFFFFFLQKNILKNNTI
jgi:hypothetical protein